MNLASPRERKRLREMLQQYLANEATGGIIMLLCAALAMVFANSSIASDYQQLITTPISLVAGRMDFTMPFDLVVNDVLMAIFFLAVGLELKHEMIDGFLAEKGQKILPLIAAAGGVATPALIYMLVNNAIPQHTSGWAIPTATDIAFAICVLSLFGKRVPPAAKIFLLAIAIYDDLAAIVIIALFYSHGVQVEPLAMAALTVCAMGVLCRTRVSYLLPYLLLGALLWHFVHAAGIHTTVAGMITGLLIPARTREGKSGPLDRLLGILHPYVAYLILPLFALVNAGVSLKGVSAATLLEPLPLGIALGLFLGKQCGIFGATWAGVKLGIASKPQGTSWKLLYAIAIIAGIGFTMSIFIGLLAFKGVMVQNEIKLGVMAGSLLSAMAGAIVLALATRKKAG